MVLRDFFKPKSSFEPQERPLYLKNTLTGEKEEFVPIVPGKVRMYSCGPTVYNIQHIGNLRAFIMANILGRAFVYNGYDLNHVMNLTDVGHLVSDADEGEDKMEKRAREQGKNVQDIAKEVTRVFYQDLKLLNAKPKDLKFVKATDHIEEQIAFVKTLEEKGYTYTTSDGVYFDTSRFATYADFAKLDLEGLEEGARVEVNEEKLNPTDFALWKFSPKDEKRQQEWNSPWGVGFPGWHIECSAMSMKHLGKRLDVHTGGIDHVPIHHTNEIAQTESVTGQRYVNYWVHNEFLNIEGKKISKSVGNVVYLHHIIERNIPALAFRYLLLTVHYSTKMNFTWDALEAATSGYYKLMKFFVEKLRGRVGHVIPEYQEKFHQYINDDLDTPKAIALLHEMTKDENADKRDLKATFLEFDHVLGLGFNEASKKLLENLSTTKKIKVSDTPDHIQDLLDEREKARGEQNYARADEIRDQIQAQGYVIHDTSEGATVEKQSN